MLHSWQTLSDFRTKMGVVTALFIHVPGLFTSKQCCLQECTMLDELK